MADTDLVFNGLWYMAGQEIAVTLCGIDCGDFTVDADGNVTVPLESDADEILTAAYIIAQDGITPGAEQNVNLRIFDGSGHVVVVVPATFGFAYSSQGQLLRPATAQDVHSSQGAGLGLTRRAHQFAMLLYNTLSISVGTDFASLDNIDLVNPDSPDPLPDNELFSGVVWDTVVDGYSFNSMLAWSIDRPAPCTIAAASLFLAAEERAGEK